jgi:hypothetical protein
MPLLYLSVLITQASAHYIAHHVRSLAARDTDETDPTDSSPSKSSATDKISTGGRVLIGLFVTAIVMVFLVLAYIGYRQADARRKAAGYNDEKHKGSKNKARVVPSPSLSGIERTGSPPPFLEPHMMSPAQTKANEQFFIDTTNHTSDTGVTLTTHGSPSSTRAPKRSFTIYGTQGPSTSSVDLSSQAAQYPIGPEHHFMSAEYEHKYD